MKCNKLVVQLQSAITLLLIVFVKNSTSDLERTKRTLPFMRGSAFGYLAAVAIPVDLPNRNVYLAFNFEANYALPTNNSYDELIEKWDSYKTYLGVRNNFTKINGRRTHRSLYTRNSFYRSLTGYFNHFEMNGTGCLLRTICEVADSRIDENNGLLGTIFKILFMPSSSKAELIKIPFPLYQAEDFGRRGECSYLVKWCPGGFLNKISVFQ